MSLVVTSGIPIPVSFDPSSFQALMPPPQIQIARLPQEEDAWCYAACAVMVIDHCIPQSFVDQCEIASFVKDAECCDETDSECIDSGCDKDQIEEIFDEWDVSSVHVPAAISFQEIKDQIDATPPRLTEAVIDWKGVPSSHAVLIAGYIEGSEMIFIVDPLNPPDYYKWHAYSYVKAGFGQGTWGDTWVDLEKGVVSNGTLR